MFILIHEISMGVTKGGEKIEDKAFSSVSLKLVKAAPLFRKFLKDIAPKIYIPDVSYEILKAFSNIDVTAEKVADFLKANPYYQYEFLKMIESKGMREELPSMDAAVILLGMQNSRDLIVSMQLLKTTKGLWPEWDKDGKLKLNPPDILKYALKTEEYLNSFKYEYSDMGYVGGLFFDVLALIAVDYAKDKKKVLDYIENIYNHGFQTAKIGLELIKTIPSVSYSKYFFAACLTHDIGKIILALIEPDYFQFCDVAAKKGLPRIIQNFTEQQKYGVSHHLLGATACHYFRLFKPIEKAILYHHHPFLLKSARKGLYQLSSLVCLSTNIASNFKKPEKANDPILKLWKGRELQDFKYDAKNLMPIVMRLAQSAS